MTTRDTPSTFGAVSRFNHWTGAMFVLALLGIGLYFADMPRGAEKTWWRSLHIAIGTVAMLFLLFRVFWRVRSASPRPLPQAPALQLLSRIVHALLLVAIVVMVVSGPLIQWFNGRPFGIFDLVRFPSPLEKSELWHTRMEDVHGWAAWTIIYLLGLHLLGVIKHLLINRDNTLGRMIGRRRFR
jgi:cytochrome b561